MRYDRTTATDGAPVSYTEVEPSLQPLGSPRAAARCTNPRGSSVHRSAQGIRTPGGGWPVHRSAQGIRTPGGGWPVHRCTASPGTGRPRPPPTHLLGLLRERVGRSHHHAGVGVRVLRQVDAGHPLPRQEERRDSGPHPGTPGPAGHGRSPAGLPASPPPSPALTQFLDLKYRTHCEPSAPLPPYTSTLPAAMPAAPTLLPLARPGRPTVRARGGTARPWVVRRAGRGCPPGPCGAGAGEGEVPVPRPSHGKGLRYYSPGLLLVHSLISGSEGPPRARVAVIVDTQAKCGRFSLELMDRTCRLSYTS